MPEASDKNWRLTRLSPLSKGLRLFGAALLLAIVLTLVFFVLDEFFRPAAKVLVVGVFAIVAALDLHFIFRRGAQWNDQLIQQTGTLLPSRLYDWNDLSNVSPNMQKRATILTFKRRGHVKLYWGFEDHREILDLAKEKLDHA